MRSSTRGSSTADSKGLSKKFTKKHACRDQSGLSESVALLSFQVKMLTAAVNRLGYALRKSQKRSARPKKREFVPAREPDIVHESTPPLPTTAPPARSNSRSAIPEPPVGSYSLADIHDFRHSVLSKTISVISKITPSGAEFFETVALLPDEHDKHRFHKWCNVLNISLYPEPTFFTDCSCLRGSGPPAVTHSVRDVGPPAIPASGKQPARYSKRQEKILQDNIKARAQLEALETYKNTVRPNHPYPSSLVHVDVPRFLEVLRLKTML